MSEPEYAADFDEPEYHFCKECGDEMQWDDCWMIDCEEGYYDEHEYDCINFAPGSYRKCETCEGAGGWWHCPSCERKRAAVTERDAP